MMMPKAEDNSNLNYEYNPALYRELKAKVSLLSEFAGNSVGPAKGFDCEDFYTLLIEQAALIMKAPVSTLRLLSRDEKLVLKDSYGLSETSNFREYISLEKSISERVAKEGTPYIINKLDSGRDITEKDLLQEDRLHSLLSVPLKTKKKVIGSLSVYSARPDSYTEDDINIMSILANQAGVIIENGRLSARSRVQSLNTVSVLVNIIDAKDSYTRGHSEKVMRYSLMIAEALGFAEQQKESIQQASLLHDIGKIGVDRGVLKKPGPLNQKEWEQIHAHPRLGAEIVDNTGLLTELVPTILHHHAKYEGGGYPNPEKRDQHIPFGARILAVADAFEAMTSNRPYRKSFSMREAKEELKRCSGTQFDPEVVDIFVNIMDGGEMF